MVQCVMHFCTTTQCIFSTGLRKESPAFKFCYIAKSCTQFLSFLINTFNYWSSWWKKWKQNSLELILSFLRKCRYSFNQKKMEITFITSKVIQGSLQNESNCIRTTVCMVLRTLCWGKKKRTAYLVILWTNTLCIKKIVTVASPLSFSISIFFNLCLSL